MPLSPLLFRSLIAVAFAAYALDQLVPAFGLVSFDPEVETALSWNYFGSAFSYTAQMVWFALWSVSTVIGLIGLAFFWRPARWILAATILASFVIQPFLGLTIYAPFQATFATLAGMITFWLTTVSFWSPLASRFENPSARVP